jgi:hypothetical protein
MPFVGFIYPETERQTNIADSESWGNLLRQYRLADDAQAGNGRTPNNGDARLADPATICMDYSIKVTRGKNIAWKPKDVYSAAGKTYVIMPEKMEVTEAPIFFIKQDGREKLTNYRVEGNIYIIDRIFDVGILTAGKDRVAIYRKNPAGKPEDETPAARVSRTAPRPKRIAKTTPGSPAKAGSDIVKPDTGDDAYTADKESPILEVAGEWEGDKEPISQDWEFKWDGLVGEYGLTETPAE